MQRAVELSPLVHARPHMPQLRPSVERSASQPLVGLLSQSPHGDSHVPAPHMPLTHAAVA